MKRDYLPPLPERAEASTGLRRDRGRDRRLRGRVEPEFTVEHILSKPDVRYTDGTTLIERVLGEEEEEEEEEA